MQIQKIGSKIISGIKNTDIYKETISPNLKNIETYKQVISTGLKNIDTYKQAITSCPISRETIANFAKNVMDTPVPFYRKVTDFFLNLKIKSIDKEMTKNVNDAKKYSELSIEKLKLKAKLSSTTKNIAKNIYEAFSK